MKDGENPNLLDSVRNTHTARLQKFARISRLSVPQSESPTGQTWK